MNWIKPDWPAPEMIHSAVTLRTGGQSTGRYASLNPALHVNDSPDIVHLNRQSIFNMLELPAQPVWLQQVHGHKVVLADQVSSPVQADASFTEKPGVVCAVLTADCLPILICDEKGTKICAVHAGWRGLLAGIISQALSLFNTPGVYIWLGPAIGPACFEVGAEVRQLFTEKSSKYKTAFKQHKADKYLADIYQLAKIELISAGVKNIYGGGFCTMTDEQHFFSYRRDGETGRMATLIWRD